MLSLRDAVAETAWLPVMLFCQSCSFASEKLFPNSWTPVKLNGAPVSCRNFFQNNPLPVVLPNVGTFV